MIARRSSAAGGARFAARATRSTQPFGWLAAAVLAFGLSAVARAADIGQCATPAAMTAMLKAEDQRSIVTAQQITADKSLFGIIITMSGDRKTGYILKADQPLGDPANQLCVYNRLADIRLFDARKPGVPAAALLKASDADAERHCDQLAAQGKFKRGACGSLNGALRRIEAFGERVVLQGLLVEKDGKGGYRPDGTLATISGRIGGSVNDFPNSPAQGILGGIDYASLPDGASVLNATLVYVEYTEYGLAALPR